jgi:hypothetical protein
MRFRLRRAVAAAAPVAVLAGLLAQPPAALATGGLVASQTAARPPVSPAPPPDRLADPGAVLAPGWRTSPDRAVAVAGDATGLHVLVADASSGYAWKTAATLTVTGTDTTQWIGQACVTGDGEHAVVVYAPRQITNDPAAMGFGALAAVVNLSTGEVTSLGAGVSIAYFDPGCGTGETAVLTQGGTGADPMPGPVVTHLLLLDVTTGKITADVAVPGQVTSAVPYGGQIAAVHGPGVVSIDAKGQISTLAKVAGRAFRLVPDNAGGLGFQVATTNRVQVHRYAAASDRIVGTAPLGAVELAPAGGHVIVTGLHATGIGAMPASWQARDVLAGADMSTTGALAITGVSTPLNVKGRSALATVPDAAQPVSITAVTAAGRKAAFTVPAAAPPRASSRPGLLPGFPGAAKAAGTASSNVTGVTAAPSRATASISASVGTGSATPLVNPPRLLPVLCGRPPGVGSGSGIGSSFVVVGAGCG